MPNSTSGIAGIANEGLVDFCRQLLGIPGERLLRSHFGAEYDAYCARTARLIPGIYYSNLVSAQDGLTNSGSFCSTHAVLISAEEEK